MLNSLRLACALTLLPATALAQAVSVPARTVASDLRERHMDEGGFASSTQPPQPSRTRPDSLWNGALIGAGLGALAGIAAGNAALDTPTAGFNVPLTFGVLGAGAGLALGIGIDLLRERRPTVLPPADRRRLVVSPLVGTKVRGMVAAVTF